MTMTSWFFDMAPASYFFNGLLFLLSSLATGPGFMSISSMVLELWQFSFIKDWPEIRKSKIPPSGLCSISGDWGKLGITNLTPTSLIKCYWMLQNPRIAAFAVSKLLRENQQGGGGKIIPPPTHIRVNRINQTYNLNVLIWKRRSKVKCSSY